MRSSQHEPDLPPDRAGSRAERLFAHEVLAVVFRVRGRALHVLLWQRAMAPSAGHWSLPGGPLEESELLGSSLSRHLAHKVELKEIGFLEQLETRSDVTRDPRGRVLATAYLALVSSEYDPTVPGDTKWCDVEDLPDLAFDHRSIIESARERLRAKLTYTNVAFALAPKTFTVATLKSIYEACLGHSVSATNLQRVLIRRGTIESTNGVVASSSLGGRPATLYRFTHHHLRVTDPFAIFRPPHGAPSENLAPSGSPSRVAPSTAVRGRAHR